MPTLFNENRILNTDDYFFLTENLEFADKSEIQSGMCFIITSKKENLKKTVKSVIENELDESEKRVIKLYYYDGLDTAEISKICRIARSTVYRNLHSGLKKIEYPIKYIMEYDGFCREMSANELLRSVKGDAV